MTAKSHGQNRERVAVEGMRRMLFLGLAHPANDTRLARFLAKAVKERFKAVECLYMGVDSIDPRKHSNEHLEVVAMPVGLSPLKRMFRYSDLELMARYILDLGVDLVQVSDVRELALGYAIKKTSSIPVIFDSHEDYFSQKYEYGGKSPMSLCRAVSARAHEIALVRFMDAVFCTDEYLEKLYKRPLFHAKQVHMVRNLPPAAMIRKAPVVHDGDTLRLVYIGSVNALRGVIETAEHCKRFNGEPAAKRLGTTLEFHVFSKPCGLTDKLAREGKIVYRGFLQGAELEEAILQLDVGVALLLFSRKFERNIPIKNFEYMALGLPILSSDFGPMKRYVGESGAGITIDPKDYEAFKKAILKLRDKSFRRALGEKGIAYAMEHFNREEEAGPYLDAVGRLLYLPERR